MTVHVIGFCQRCWAGASRRSPQRSLLLFMLLVCAGTLAGCEGARAKAPPVPAARAAVLGTIQPARWRLAPQKLSRVLLRVSDIVIGYAGSPLDPLAQTRPSTETKQRPTRSREQAKAAAEALAGRLQRRPELFAEQAAKISDDRITAELGGSFGTVLASTLPPTFLDVIAELKPNQVSAPFETYAGFVILKLEQTPAEEALAAARVVVSYDGCPTALRQGRSVRRTREQARLLAQQIASKARDPGASFSELVEQYTDSEDVAQHGDIGRWSNYVPRGAALLLEAIRRQPLGGVTDPIDTIEGFQILQRTSDAPRPLFSAEYLFLPYQTADERRPVLQQMQSIVSAVSHDPRQFDVLRKSTCCTQPAVWSLGLAPTPEMQTEVASLRVDELSLRPIESPGGFYLVRRLPVPEQEVLHPDLLRELPSPATPDLAELLPLADPRAVAGVVAAVGAAVQRLPLTSDPAARVQESLRWLGTELERSAPDARASLVATFWNRLRTELSAKDVAFVQHLVDVVVAQQLMTSS